MRYDAVNAMLLNEFLKEHRKVEAVEGLPSDSCNEANCRAQRAGIQIQKVSAQLEASKPAPQMVNNP